MSFLERLYKENSRRKEIKEELTRKRAPTNTIPNSTFFRRDPLGTAVIDNELYQEQAGTNEIVCNSSSQFDAFSNPDHINYIHEETVVCENRASPPLPFCFLEIGLEHYHSPPENRHLIEKKLDKLMLGRLELDFTACDQLSVSDHPEMKTLGFALRGVMLSMNKLNEKLLNCKPDDAIINLKTIFDPNMALLAPKEEVKGIDNSTDVCANTILAEIPAQDGTLRVVINNISNHWLRAVLPYDQWAKYSTSVNPQHPQIPFPARLLNSPIRVLVECLTVNEASCNVNVTVALLFKMHMNGLFTTARSKIKQSKRRKD